MCAQCWASGMTAAAGASGLRAWLATRRLPWLTGARMRAATVALVLAGVLAASLGLGGA